MGNNQIRVLMSKPGIDGHWRGGIVVSRALRDAGMELIFGGFQNIEQIVESAIQEDVDVIGLSIHSGAHFAYTQQVIDLLNEKMHWWKFLALFNGLPDGTRLSQIIEIRGKDIPKNADAKYKARLTELKERFALDVEELHERQANAADNFF